MTVPHWQRLDSGINVRGGDVFHYDYRQDGSFTLSENALEVTLLLAAAAGCNLVVIETYCGWQHPEHMTCRIWFKQVSEVHSYIRNNTDVDYGQRQGYLTCFLSN
ncbi:unnamed protein product [Symbiodinium sp. CCMP2592]|nr:unnamed protein product [Symbiodinium sp. CCMP2592]CAE7612291.1 unnamed protein product [Symbiodinium sp. CCMP2592]